MTCVNECVAVQCTAGGCAREDCQCQTFSAHGSAGEQGKKPITRGLVQVTVHELQADGSVYALGLTAAGELACFEGASSYNVRLFWNEDVHRNGDARRRCANARAIVRRPGELA